MKISFPLLSDPRSKTIEAYHIRNEAAKHGLKFAIAVDNKRSNWNARNNRCWSTVYVVDKRGRVRYRWEGEFSDKGTADEETVRKSVDALLLERS